MTQAEVDAWIEQWELANQWLDLVAGSKLEKTFDLMLIATVEFGKVAKGARGNELIPKNCFPAMDLCAAGIV